MVFIGIRILYRVGWPVGSEGLFSMRKEDLGALGLHGLGLRFKGGFSRVV